ncbi:MAG: hypothetical protein ABNH03_08550 [Alteromonas sp.]|uniref:hypothetical protein n=1 Tax=Alteromonas sp. TaxID=232 RepID=UPI0032D8F9BF
MRINTKSPASRDAGLFVLSVDKIIDVKECCQSTIADVPRLLASGAYPQANIISA